MEQLVNASLAGGSFGALLRARRLQALLSQEQLAARAALSERTVRNLEAGRVRSPRTDTVRLLADALRLSDPERESWFAAVRRVNHQRAEPAAPGAGGPLQPFGDPPAPLSLTACGVGMGNKHWHHRPPTAEFTARSAEPWQCDERDDRGQTAEGFDPAETSAQAWVNEGEQDAGTRSDGQLTSTERRELAELRRENRKLREDVEILKQVTAIFATAIR
jgi:transposase